MEPTGPEQANDLWVAGRRDEAASQLQDLLRLHPDDRSGLVTRWPAICCFWIGTTNWKSFFTSTPTTNRRLGPTQLLCWLSGGTAIPSKRARLLKAARKSNKHVSAYLLGEKFPPAEPPSRYRLCSDAEAIQYIRSTMAGWKSTPGAVAWPARECQTQAAESRGP